MNDVIVKTINSSDVDYFSELVSKFYESFGNNYNIDCYYQPILANGVIVYSALVVARRKLV